MITKQFTVRVIGVGAMALAAVCLTAPTPAAAALTYTYVCDEPTCGGDATLSGTSFTFNYANAAAAAGQTITAASPLFLGWTATTSFNGGLNASGTTFVLNSNADLTFKFSADGTQIEDMMDSVGAVFDLGPNEQNVVGIGEGTGFSYSLRYRIIGGIQDNTIIPGTFTLQADPIPEPATLALLGTGILGLAAARRRRGA